MSKVLHVMSGFGGGISSFILNKAIALKGTDVSFDVLTYDDCNWNFTSAIEKTGGQIFHMPNPKKSGWKLFYKTVNNIMAVEPGNVVVHCHIQGYRALPFYLIAKKNKIKRFIIHAHTDAEESITKSFRSKFDRVINKYIADEKVSCGIKATAHIFGEQAIENNEVMHIPNSIDENKFLRLSNRSEVKKDILGEKYTNFLVIGNVARFHNQKNHMFMIEIIEKLSKEKKDFIWVFIGGGALKSMIEKIVNDKGLSSHVLFLGVRNDLPDLYSIMDLFVLPSLYEGLPTVAVEAQASGVPTLLSDRITKEVNLGIGLIEYLPIDSVEAWVNKILSISLTEKLTSLAERQDALKSNKFTNQASANLYKDFLDKKIENYKII